MTGRVLDLGNEQIEPVKDGGRVLNIDGQMTPAQKQNMSYEKALRDRMKNLNPVQAFGVGVSRGVGKLADLVGIGDPQSEYEKQAYSALQKESPTATMLGEVTGEAAPFMVPGAGISMITQTPARVAAAATLGALEGGVLANANNRPDKTLESAGTGGIIAGSLEAIFPIIGRLGGSLVRKVTGNAPVGAVIDKAGKPTAELVNALSVAGITYDDLTEAAKTLLKKQSRVADPAEAARLATFKELDIPATKGDISKAFDQQASEARLVESTNDSLGDPLRELRLQQSEKITDHLNKLAGDRPEDLGSVKEALSGRDKILMKQKNALYKEMEGLDPRIKALELDVSSIADAIPNDKKMRQLAITSEDSISQLDKTLQMYGIKPAAEGVEVTPLTIDDFDDFRMILNRIERGDKTGAASVAIGPIRNALDDEADIIAKSLKKAGIADENVLDPLKKARAIVSQRKTEFSPDAITGKLIKAKRDGVSQVVEASQVWKKIAGKQTPPEYLERVITSLNKSGSRGAKAIGDLQAQAVLSFLDESLKANSRTIKGVPVFGPIPFMKAVDSFGERRLKVLFKNRPDVIKRLSMIRAAAASITPANAAVPKGSATVMLDITRMLRRAGLSKIPAIDVVIEQITRLGDASQQRAILDNALSATPTKTIAGVIEREFPSLASAIGIAGVASAPQEDK